MADELYTVGLEVKADTPEVDRFGQSLRALTSTINDCTTRLQTMQNQFNTNANAVRQSASAFSSFQGILSPLESQITTLVATMTAMFGVVAVATKTWNEFKSAIQITGQLKDLGETFLSLAGNTQVAQQQLTGIMRFWRTTKIFDQTDLINAATNMKLFGIATENIVPYLQRLATGAAAVNSNVVAMEGAMEQMVRGRLMAHSREMQIIIRQIGVDIGDETKAIQRLMEGTPEERIRMITRAVEELGTKGSASFGAIESKQEQYTGKVMALQQQWIMLKEQFAAPIIDALSPILDVMIGNMENGTTRAEEWGNAVADAIEKVDKWIRSVNWSELFDDWTAHLDKYQKGWEEMLLRAERFGKAMGQLNYPSRYNPSSGQWETTGGTTMGDLAAEQRLRITGGGGAYAGLSTGPYGIPLAETGQTFGARLTQPYYGANAKEGWLAPVDPNAKNQIVEGIQGMNNLDKAVVQLGADAQVMTDYWKDYNDAMMYSADATSREYHIMEALEKAIKGLGNPMREIEKLIVGLSPDRQNLARWQAWRETVNRAMHESELRMKAGMASMGESVKWGLQTMSDEWGTMQVQVGKSVVAIGNALSSNIASGLTDILMGTKSLKDGFREMAIAVIKDIERIILQMLVQLAIQRLLGAFGMTSSFATPVYMVPAPGKQRGGRIGTGYGGGDRMPAMLEEGEFVWNKQAASAFGYDRLEELNRRYGGGDSPRVENGVAFASPGMIVRAMTVGRWHGERNYDANYYNGYRLGKYDVHSSVLPLGTRFRYRGQTYTVRGTSDIHGRRAGAVEFMDPAARAWDMDMIDIDVLGGRGGYGAGPSPGRWRGGGGGRTGITRTSLLTQQRAAAGITPIQFTPTQRMAWGLVDKSFPATPRATYRLGQELPITPGQEPPPSFMGFPATETPPLGYADYFGNYQWSPPTGFEMPPTNITGGRPMPPSYMDLAQWPQGSLNVPPSDIIGYPTYITDMGGGYGGYNPPIYDMGGGYPTYITQPSWDLGYTTEPSPWNPFGTTSYGAPSGGEFVPSDYEYPTSNWGFAPTTPVAPLVGEVGGGGYNPELGDFGAYTEQPWVDTYQMPDYTGGGVGAPEPVRQQRVIRQSTRPAFRPVRQSSGLMNTWADYVNAMQSPWVSTRLGGGYYWTGGTGAMPTSPAQWYSASGGYQIGAYGVRGGGGSYFGASSGFSPQFVGGQYVGGQALPIPAPSYYGGDSPMVNANEDFSAGREAHYARTGQAMLGGPGYSMMLYRGDLSGVAYRAKHPEEAAKYYKRLADISRAMFSPKGYRGSGHGGGLEQQAGFVSDWLHSFKEAVWNPTGGSKGQGAFVQVPAWRAWSGTLNKEHPTWLIPGAIGIGSGRALPGEWSSAYYHPWGIPKDIYESPAFMQTRPPVTYWRDGKEVKFVYGKGWEGGDPRLDENVTTKPAEGYDEWMRVHAPYGGLVSSEQIFGNLWKAQEAAMIKAGTFHGTPRWQNWVPDPKAQQIMRDWAAKHNVTAWGGKFNQSNVSVSVTTPAAPRQWGAGRYSRFRNYDMGGVADYALMMQTGGRVKAGEVIFTPEQTSRLAPASVGQVNNVSISIINQGGGNVTSEVRTSGDGGLTPEDARHIARLVTQVCRSTIARETRPGGQLYAPRAG